MFNKAHVYGFIAGVIAVGAYHYLTGTGSKASLPTKKL